MKNLRDSIKIINEERTKSREAILDGLTQVTMKVERLSPLGVIPVDEISPIGLAPGDKRPKMLMDDGLDYEPHVTSIDTDELAKYDSKYSADVQKTIMRRSALLVVGDEDYIDHEHLTVAQRQSDAYQSYLAASENMVMINWINKSRVADPTKEIAANQAKKQQQEEAEAKRAELLNATKYDDRYDELVVQLTKAIYTVSRFNPLTKVPPVYQYTKIFENACRNIKNYADQALAAKVHYGEICDALHDMWASGLAEGDALHHVRVTGLVESDSAYADVPLLYEATATYELITRCNTNMGNERATIRNQMRAWKNQLKGTVQKLFPDIESYYDLPLYCLISDRVDDAENRFAALQVGEADQVLTEERLDEWAASIDSLHDEGRVAITDIPSVAALKKQMDESRERVYTERTLPTRGGVTRDSIRRAPRGGAFRRNNRDRNIGQQEASNTSSGAFRRTNRRGQDEESEHGEAASGAFRRANRRGQDEETVRIPVPDIRDEDLSYDEYVRRDASPQGTTTRQQRPVEQYRPLTRSDAQNTPFPVYE